MSGPENWPDVFTFDGEHFVFKTSHRLETSLVKLGPDEYIVRHGKVLALRALPDATPERAAQLEAEDSGIVIEVPDL